jgi:predicted ATP-grasp superfamily ATP-dependent carboligase
VSDLGAWLRKPVRSGGGAAIVRVGDAPPPCRSKGRGFYYQRLASGESYSSVHLAGKVGSQLLGVTRQLVGAPWLHAPAFTWCGSVGPISLPPPVTAVLARAGDAAAWACGLRGLFGIDFLLDGMRVQPVEVNPRYPASTEIIEHGLGIRAIRLHAAACADDFDEEAVPEPPPLEARAGMLGKAVVYAPRDVTVASRLEPGAVDPHRFPAIADIPAPGAAIPAGRPILTVFAQGATVEECEAALRRAAAEVMRHLAFPL